MITTMTTWRAAPRHLRAAARTGRRGVRGRRAAALPRHGGSGACRRPPTSPSRPSRPDGSRQLFAFEDKRRLPGIARRDSRAACLCRHGFAGAGGRERLARARLRGARSRPAAHHRDNNMRAAIVHVHGRRRGLGAGDRRAAPGARLRLALDGPARRPHRRARHRQLVGRAHPRHRRHPARPHAGSAALPTTSAHESRARATASPTCICGGSGPAISAPSSASRQAPPARPRTTGSAWPASPTCPMSPSRSSTRRARAAEGGALFTSPQRGKVNKRRRLNPIEALKDTSRSTGNPSVPPGPSPRP